MPDPASLAVFLAAALVLHITPGPAVLYIVGRSLGQGRAAGLVSALGIGVGALFHVAATIVGVSALLASSVLAFQFVKWMGAAYLVYLGVQRLRAPDGGARGRPVTPQPLVRLFWQGVVVNFLNPKTALFLFAFLPQFVNVSKGAAGLQMLVLGVLFVVQGVLSDSLWALAAGGANRWLAARTGVLRAQRYFTGTLFIGLGLATALSGGSRK